MNNPEMVTAIRKTISDSEAKGVFGLTAESITRANPDISLTAVESLRPFFTVVASRHAYPGRGGFFYYSSTVSALADCEDPSALSCSVCGVISDMLPTYGRGDYCYCVRCEDKSPALRYWEEVNNLAGEVFLLAVSQNVNVSGIECADMANELCESHRFVTVAGYIEQTLERTHNREEVETHEEEEPNDEVRAYYAFERDVLDQAGKRLEMHKAQARRIGGRGNV